MKKALITVTIGESYRQIAELTHRWIGAYAAQIAVDFIVSSLVLNLRLQTKRGFSPFFGP